ncbi:MAG: isoprenyl transferase [Clostridia bacterium]|nr:isoprenyl transferase [Clostridia bacterium]
MFAEKLTRLFRNMRRTQPKYICATVAPGGLIADRQLPPEHVPAHVAIIMDGNGRWAQKRGLPRSSGHAAGTEALRDIIRASDDWGIKALSIYAFSTENWARSKEEVNALMGLLLKYFKSEIDELDEKNVCIRILGDVDGLPDAQREAVISAMERTKDNTGLKLNIALNYGGHAELTRAAKLIAQDVADGKLTVDQITDQTIEDHLYTAGIPNVDLLIRTSGEMRTSNFLPWQLAYAEMIFDPVYWPDFDRAHYLNDLRIYASRNRRFGGVQEEQPEVKL